MADTFDAPQSRNEAILQNMLGANNTLPAPQSRIEELLQEILEQGGGKFYEHNIGIYTKSNVTVRKIAVTTIIINRDPTKFDYDRLMEYLYAETSSKPFGNGKEKIASGTYMDITNNLRYEVYGIKRVQGFLRLNYLRNDADPGYASCNKTDTTIEDAVVEI